MADTPKLTSFSIYMYEGGSGAGGSSHHSAGHIERRKKLKLDFLRVGKLLTFLKVV